MDEEQYRLYRNHLPIADPETEPFWTGAREGRLRIQRCAACGPYFYPRSHCPKCWSTDVEWFDASGRGTLYSYTVITHNDVPTFKPWVPYAVVLVSLEEGPRLVSHVVDCDPGSLRIGMPLEVAFEKIDDTVTLPKFRPARGKRSPPDSIGRFV